MKSFYIPILPIHVLAMLLIGLCLLLGLDASPAYADFTFGEPVNVVIPGLNYDPIECFSCDGLEMFTSSIRPDGYGSYDIYVLRRDSKDAEWRPPENLGPAVNSQYEDTFSCISDDGLVLYFSSKRIGEVWFYDIYMTTRATRNDPWNQAVNIGPNINNPSYTDGEPWISPDGLELYFESYRPGGYGLSDIYVARRPTTSDPWDAPINLGPLVNSAYTEQWLSLSPDGLLLFFNDVDAPYRPGGYGSNDIWMARRASLSAPWQAPVNLGPKVNSPLYDGVPRLSRDGRTLYFWTSRSGGYENWQVPILPICDFNGDGQANGKDLLCMTYNWGTNDPLCDIGPFPWGDGTVDLQDVIVLAEYIGKEVIDPALIAHWKLDESEGTAAVNSAGGKDAFVLGDAVWQPEGGQVGGALQLDGVDDCVVTGFDLDLSEGPFSVLAWIKGGAPGQVVISHTKGIVGTNCLMVDAEGRLMTELGSSNGVNSILLSQLSQKIITNGQWHRIGLAWDGSYRHLYVDGEEVAIDDGPLPGLESGKGGMYIGAGESLEDGTFFSGLIDDVRIYSRAVHP